MAVLGRSALKKIEQLNSIPPLHVFIGHYVPMHFAIPPSARLILRSGMRQLQATPAYSTQNGPICIHHPPEERG